MHQLAHRPFGDLLTDPDALRFALEQSEAETDALRRLLRVALMKRQKPEQAARLRDALKQRGAVCGD
jgi:hypothetical protein